MTNARVAFYLEKESGISQLESEASKRIYQNPSGNLGGKNRLRSCRTTHHCIFTSAPAHTQETNSASSLHSSCTHTNKPKPLLKHKVV